MENHDFRVSAIITSYNQKDYLIEAIESVINQTVKPHEIIIADDHSTKDDSVELIRDYMARYPGWVKGVFQEQNVGIPKNRNAALRQVTGNYVSILDGDDRFVPFKLEKELEALQKNPTAQCVYSNVEIIDPYGNATGVRDKKNQPSGNIYAYIAKGKFGLLRSMLIKYDLLKKIGFLDERFPKYDGFELSIELSKRCEFVYIGKPLVEYRVHPESDSKGLTPKEHLHDLEGIYQKIHPLLADISVADKNIIEKGWSKLLLRWRVREAINSGKKVRAFFITLQAITKGYVNLIFLVKRIKTVIRT